MRPSAVHRTRRGDTVSAPSGPAQPAGSAGPSSSGYQFLPPPEHAEIRAAVRQISAGHGITEYAARGRKSAPQTQLWAELADAGFLGVNVPEQFGGGGMGMSELAVVAEGAASVGCPLLLTLVSCAINVEILARHGSAEQQQEWLPKLAAGRKLAFAITEPDAGSNSHQIATTAKPVDPGDPAGDWLISGQKYYISGVDESDAILTVTRTGTDERGRAEMTLFLVPVDADQLTAHRIDVAAQIPDRQFTLFYDDVRVPASAAVGGIGTGFRPLFDGLNPERIASAALCVGIGRYALDAAADYARNRQVWGTPIGAHQGVSHPLAQAKINVELAALALSRAAWLHDNKLDAAEACNMAKAAAADAAVAAVDAAIQAHGGNGLAQEYGLMQLYGMARLLRIAPVSKEMVLNYVAQHTLKLPRSY
ncbi:acyl-CoA/acyl-ACP dehydrogenase [Nakamurella sp. DB0629]|uniref:Acyl-CoA/acyl-ACP dehydrogenase n=1 Tax=Nakamurella aerolata TaxID=1656892 RepID=A0A849AAD3_9ACTN|nr:acyl-CoA dehydrogenase family protein [Nakamurella aerolata]NNG36573.1 acyl-CoA/acyl-ACP dehydrogenase [Nakamurella aerolata]